MHIIDADKLLEVINAGMAHSWQCCQIESINSKGEYDVVSDVIRHMDLFTYNHLKIIKDYVKANMV